MRNSSVRTRGFWWVLVAWLMACVGLLLPWWRNHGMLRDFYDYGNVMSAVGRMKLGEHPYVDFLTPIQTLPFLIARVAEGLWGARYLSLTYANAIFIVVTFAAFALLLARPLGRPLALLIAAAVVCASSVQHTIVWYNSLGVTWVALVVWPTARLPARTGARVGNWIVVLGALSLGGMTKLTYQAGALAFAVLFTWRSAFRGEISRRMAAWLTAAWVFAGVIAPVVTELAMTGATFEQWRHNVLGLASSRTSLLKPIATLGFYLRTPHYYYEPMYLPWVGAWGVVLLAITGTAAAAATWRQRGWQERTFCVMAIGGAAACGAVFLAAHYEIAYMSGAAWLVLATGVVVGFVPREASWPSRQAQTALVAGAATLLVTAWPSAWMGARSLYGHGRLDRREFVTANGLPPRYDYLRDLRILRRLRESLANFAGYEDQLVADGVPAKAFYFVNGTDWMVRAVPEARHPGLPLWLQYGTTYDDADEPQIGQRLGDGSEMQVLVALDGWVHWSPQIESVVNGGFRAGHVWPMLHVFRPHHYSFALPIRAPLDFASNTNSNLFSKEMTVTGGPLDYFSRPEGSFAGTSRSHRIQFQFGLYGLSGSMVAELLPNRREPVSAVTFRIRAEQPGTDGQLLWNQTVVLTPGEPKSVQPFSVSPGGRRLSLEVEVPPGAELNAGWRSLKTDHAGELGVNVPGPMDPELRVWPVDASSRAGLFATGSPRTAEVHAFGADLQLAGPEGKRELRLRGQSEVWFRVDRPAGHITGEFVWTGSKAANTATSPEVKVAVVYCKSGRFDPMLRRELRPAREAADRGPQPFEAWLPEGEGWIGLVARPQDNADGEIAWRNVRVW